MRSKKNAVFAYDATTMFLPDDRFTFGREPTLRRMPDGSLISFVYTGGHGEPDPDNVVTIIRSEDDGATWSRPQVLFEHPARCCWGTEICTDAERPFCVFQSFDFATMYKDMNTFICYTDDSGKTWTPPENIRGVPANVIFRQCKKLSDGTLLAPVYWQEIRGDWLRYNNPQVNISSDKWMFVSGALRSTDQGKTFSLHGYHSLPEVNLWEPEAVELENNHILMLMRNNSNLKKTESFDGGITWTKVEESSIPNATTKFVIYKVKDRIVLVNNIPIPGKWRGKLEMWVSDDLCKTWRLKLPLAELTEPPVMSAPWSTKYPYRQVSYPHGFADDEKELLYLAIDCVTEFFLVKVPYADLLQ